MHLINFACAKMIEISLFLFLQIDNLQSGVFYKCDLSEFLTAETIKVIVRIIFFRIINRRYIPLFWSEKCVKGNTFNRRCTFLNKDLNYNRSRYLHKLDFQPLWSWFCLKRFIRFIIIRWFYFILPSLIIFKRCRSFPNLDVYFASLFGCYCLFVCLSVCIQ